MKLHKRHQGNVKIEHNIYVFVRAWTFQEDMQRPEINVVVSRALSVLWSVNLYLMKKKYAKTAIPA